MSPHWLGSASGIGRVTTEWERLAISGLFGAGLTWLGMLETGLADRWDAGAVVMSVSLSVNR